MTIQTVNPATGKNIHSYEEMDKTTIDKIIDSAHAAFLTWREFSFERRGEVFHNVAKLLEKNKQEYAHLMTQEMGKPIRFSVGEIEKCQWACRYFAENAKRMLAPQEVKTEKNKSYFTYQPLGVIFAIMPWNYPFWQVFRFAAPGLMAGNTAILSHAPITTGCGLAIAELFAEAGAPLHLFQTVVIDNDMAAYIIRQRHIKGVTLTGSPRAGSIVGSEAATALKKVVLELGGSDPYLVLEDADLEKAAKISVASRLNNSGQVCIAAKRIIVVEKVREQFEKLVMAELQNYPLGDPLQAETVLGPLAREDLRATVHQQVEACVKKGAVLVTGGKIPDQPGFYYPPTVLKNITADMPAMTEEIFGPVIALINAKDEADALSIANDSDYGLAAGVFTRDLARGEKLAEQINVGVCAVNIQVSSDPRLPFGGINRSGFGRELGEAGIREFTNIKTIIICNT